MSQTSTGTYHGYRGLPVLAGLCSMEEAQQSDWSLEQSVDRLKRVHYLLLRLHEIFTSRITAEPIYELKTAFSYHAYLCAEQVSAVRQRVGEMREPPLGLERIPHPGLQRYFEEIQAAPRTEDLLFGLYEHAIPTLLAAAEKLERDAHPLADAPTRRVMSLLRFEMQQVRDFGDRVLSCLLTEMDRQQLAPWKELLDACLLTAGGADGTDREQGEVPAPFFSEVPYHYDPVPQRDERFIDSFNAGFNPEAFLYDEAFSPRDKTLAMYYKRIRELDVPEMMASILHEIQDEPWEFYEEMSRQLWDEARHAMLGEVGFVRLGVDWRNIPINFTWSRNLNTQLTARERHGVLFYIEQGLMPRNGKRFEWEVGQASGDSFSALVQDFDWADEVLHSQIGRRWYVPKYQSLNEALAYGDACWSKVLSHWREDLEEGRTEHRNWWPDLYVQACRHWGVEPDPQALAFAQTYEEIRADLKGISASG